MFGRGQKAREPYGFYADRFAGADPGELARRSAKAKALSRLTGNTVNIYGMNGATERLIPFDIVPGIISAQEWRGLARGIERRVRALDAFLHDICHRQEIIRACRLPAQMNATNEAFLSQIIGVAPPGLCCANAEVQFIWLIQCRSWAA